MRRRAALVRIGAPLVGGLAGCLTGTNRTTPSPTPRGTPTARFEVLERTCGQGTDRATVAFEGDRVRVDGTIGGSDTCDTAVLEDARADGGTLELAVATVRETVTGTPVCGQCLTDIDYRARVANAAAVDAVIVRHDGERIAREERP